MTSRQESGDAVQNLSRADHRHVTESAWYRERSTQISSDGIGLFLNSPAESARFYFGFLFALQNLFGRDVDLVESAAIQNPYFLKSIATERVLLYAA
jgi:hypothetical protein